MKTLEGLIKFSAETEQEAYVMRKMATEILRVAEEWVDNDVEVGWDSAKELYNFLKSYINSTNMEGGE